MRKPIVSAPGAEFAWVMAHRKVPGVPSSRVLTTVNEDGTVRSSSPSTAIRHWGEVLRRVRVAGRMGKLRIQERVVMGKLLERDGTVVNGRSNLAGILTSRR